MQQGRIAVNCCLYLALHDCNTGVGCSQVDTDDVGTSGCMAGRAGTAGGNRIIKYTDTVCMSYATAYLKALKSKGPVLKGRDASDNCNPHQNRQHHQLQWF